MNEYLDNIMIELPEKYKGTAVKPAVNHIVEVNENTKKLTEDTAQVFYIMAAKLLFLSMWAYPGILTSISFLMIHVREPGEDDGNKLARTMKYLKADEVLVLNLESDGSGNMKWWVDAAFSVHHNMQSHTGGMLSLGKGAIYLAPTKQKLNMKSSTEAELVGIDDLIPLDYLDLLFSWSPGLHGEW